MAEDSITCSISNTWFEDNCSELGKIPLLGFRLAMNIAVNNSEGMNLKTSSKFL